MQCKRRRVSTRASDPSLRAAAEASRDAWAGLRCVGLRDGIGQNCRNWAVAYVCVVAGAGVRANAHRALSTFPRAHATAVRGDRCERRARGRDVRPRCRARRKRYRRAASVLLFSFAELSDRRGVCYHYILLAVSLSLQERTWRGFALGGLEVGFTSWLADVVARPVVRRFLAATDRAEDEREATLAVALPLYLYSTHSWFCYALRDDNDDDATRAARRSVRVAVELLRRAQSFAQPPPDRPPPFDARAQFASDNPTLAATLPEPGTHSAAFCFCCRGVTGCARSEERRSRPPPRWFPLS